jgi:hypothetical protein
MILPRQLHFSIFLGATMFKQASTPSREDLASAFSRLGWIGFWVQVALGAIPTILLFNALIFGASTNPGTRAGLPLVEYLAIAGLLIMAFTTIWSFRYTRLAKQLADPQNRSPQRAARRAAWIGVLGSTLGLVFSMLIMLLEVTQLLFYFLRAPQAGVPVIQTSAGGPPSWVSTSDIMSLLALNVIMFGELIVLIFSLWLLFRTAIGTGHTAD